MTDTRCTCACHWLNKRPQPAARFTHTQARVCCNGGDVIIREMYTAVQAVIHYEKPTITVHTTSPPRWYED